MGSPGALPLRSEAAGMLSKDQNRFVGYIFGYIFGINYIANWLWFASIVNVSLGCVVP